MKIECEHNPLDLMELIGDPYFSICDEKWDELYRHKNHPDTVRITDCENNQTIDVTGETREDTRRIAEALCRLLNQDYKIVNQD